MKIERPRLGGCVFVRRRPSSSVVVTDFFRVPCFKTGIAGRKRPASRNNTNVQKKDFKIIKFSRTEIIVVTPAK